MRKRLVESVGIKSRRGSPVVDYMPENSARLVEILDDCNNLHLRAALALVVRFANCSRMHPGTHEGGNLVDLREKTGPAFCAAHKALGLRCRLRGIAGPRRVCAHRR